MSFINFNDSFSVDAGLTQKSNKKFENIANLCRNDKIVELCRYCHPPAPEDDFPMISFLLRAIARDKSFVPALSAHFPLGMLAFFSLNHPRAHLVTDFSTYMVMMMMTSGMSLFRVFFLDCF